MTKYNPSAPPKASEKFWVIVLVAAMATGFCFFIPLWQEQLSGIKYAPIGQLYLIFGICLLWVFPVMFYMGHRAWRAQTNRSLILRMLASLIVTLFISALPHQINLFFAEPETHEVSMPVKKNHVNAAPHAAEILLLCIVCICILRMFKSKAPS